MGALAVLVARVQLGSDVKPPRDREMQKNASFGAIVTLLWVPAPCSPQHSGLASGPEKAKQVRALLPSCQGTGGNDPLTPQNPARGNCAANSGQVSPFYSPCFAERT